MATYLFAWELGLGLGHLVNLRPLAAGLRERGHRVELVLRNLAQARTIFTAAEGPYWQSPYRQLRPATAGPTLSFAQILFENGFCDALELAAHGDAWRNIFRAVDPDVILFDHSPTALLAARGLRAKRVTVGTGFFLPVDESPLRSLQPSLNPDPMQIAAHEQSVLAIANRALELWKQAPLGRLAELYHPADEHLLLTFAQLDHYGTRVGATYWGAWTGGFGKKPVWPNAPGKKIYAYLKPFPQLNALLELLRRSAQPTIVFGGEIAETVREHFAGPTMRFEREPLDIERVAVECDVAILNANHGTVISFLRAGKPSLQIPVYVEQSLLAMALMKIGAALAAPPHQPHEIARQLEVLLRDPNPTPGAAAFAEQYANFDADRQISQILDRLEGLAG